MMLGSAQMASRSELKSIVLTWSHAGRRNGGNGWSWEFRAAYDSQATWLQHPNLQFTPLGPR